MIPEPAMQEFVAERTRLGHLTRRGIGMPAAGMVYWIIAVVLLRLGPQETALVW